jgi:hypothetical protein
VPRPRIYEAMKEILDFALRNSALLYLPAIGFVLTLVMLRIKKRFVNDGAR